MANKKGNPENLIPNSERTPAERKERAKKMGVASGASRRKKRDAKETIRQLMEMPCPKAAADSLKKTLGIEKEDATNLMSAAVALLQEAMNGNINAFNTLMEYGGYAPDQKLRDEERQARINAIKETGRAGAIVSGDSDAEGGGGDVIIYLPEVESDEEEPDDEESEGKSEPVSQEDS